MRACESTPSRVPACRAWETDALIVDAVRSPIGRENGTLSHIRGDDLSAQVLNGLIARNGVDPAEIEDVQWGCVTQVNEQAWNIGRNVALTAGWPVSVAARPSTASAARRCRRTSTRPPRSGRASSTSSSPAASR